MVQTITRRKGSAGAPTPTKAPKTGPIPHVGPFSVGASIKQVIQRLFATGEPVHHRVVSAVDNRPGRSVWHGKNWIGNSLKQNTKAGNTTPSLPRIPYKTNETPAQIRARRQRSLANSPLVLEALRNRLTGGRIGSPRKTGDDVRRLGHLHGLGLALRADEKAGRTKSAATRERIRSELEGEIGFIRRTLRKGQEAAETLTGRIARKFGGIFDLLTKDKLSRGLKGLGVGGASTAENAPMLAKGFDPGSPHHGRTMMSVQSSNVAAVGWEPEDPKVKRHQLNDLGTLYIQFRNGWMYQYVNAPRWLYDGLLRAGSKGKFVWAAIRRGLYPDGVPYGSTATEGYERIK